MSDSKKGISVNLLPEDRVFTWFFRALRKHRLLAIGTLALAIVGSVLTEIVLPLSISQFLRDIGGAHGVVELPAILIAGAIGAALLVPLRTAIIRHLEAMVRSELSSRIGTVLANRTNAFSKQNIELDSAIKTFLEAWSRMGIAFFTHGPVLFVAGIGMAVAMALRAPFMLVVMSVVVVLAIVAALTVGRGLVKASGARVRLEHAEYETLDNMIASHKSLWLLRLTSALHKQALRRWSYVAPRHSRAVLLWQTAAHGLTYGLLVGAVVGSVAIAGQGELQVDTSFLLVWFSVMMMGHINSLFMVGEAFGSSLAEAQALATELGASQYRPAPSTTQVQQVRLRDLRITYPPSEEGEAPTVVRFPDATFEPGLTAITGRNGGGKSSALMAVTGMIPYAGSITYETAKGPLEACDIDARQLSVLSTQGNASLGSLTIQNLFGDAGIHEIYRALHWSGFSDKITLSRRLDRLSGGQRRMVYNAAAIHAACESHVLLMDEPTNDLSAKTIGNMVAGLEEFLRDHSRVIVVVVTHDASLLESAQRIGQVVTV